ncbi:hypothetical protein DL93DRAFT_2071576 [Clavulina sp. PMI_390]|nr:hypothetical protein DL93DRAFT_2071576 [Clavulina sp. PMI_390]
MERIKLIDILETDTLDRSKALQLLYTLPNRAPPDDQASRPQSNDPLPNGHHLIYFSPLISESELNTDGTDPTYNSPPPFTRRMWAGGSFEFHPRHKLRIGEDVSCRTTVASVDYKITGSEPMIFVNQLRDFKNSRGETAVTERRTHVFLKPPTTGKHSTKASPVVRDGTEPVDFTFSCTPSPATLFRFSALTFNSHYIHLDPEFSRNVDGHPGMYPMHHDHYITPCG